MGGWFDLKVVSRDSWSLPDLVNKIINCCQAELRMLEQIADKKTMAGRMMNESAGAAPADGLRSQLRQFLSKLAVSPRQKIECRLCWE